MSLSRRLRTLVVGTLAIAALAASHAQLALAQPRWDDGRVVHSSAPQFVATAVNFEAHDETGANWWGSDEVHAVFVDFGSARERTTTVYGDVDAGETKNFRAEDRCIAPQPNCDRGAGSLHFGVALWERDKPGFPFSGSDFCPGSLGGGPYLYNIGICAGDDLIGRAEVRLSQAQLVAALPAVGAIADYTVRPTGGAGSYSFTYRITRLPDAHIPPVIGPPRQPTPITLQATPLSGLVKRVELTWSGATGSSVDIYRNGAALTSTANDGLHEDLVVIAGTYRYRVCNAGTTVCSAEVTAVVT